MAFISCMYMYIQIHSTTTTTTTSLSGLSLSLSTPAFIDTRPIKLKPIIKYSRADIKRSDMILSRALYLSLSVSHTHTRQSRPVSRIFIWLSLLCSIIHWFGVLELEKRKTKNRTKIFTHKNQQQATNLWPILGNKTPKTERHNHTDEWNKNNTNTYTQTHSTHSIAVNFIWFRWCVVVVAVGGGSSALCYSNDGWPSNRTQGQLK